MDFISGQRDGIWHWRASRGGVEIWFAGKGSRGGREAVLRRLVPKAAETAWLEQVHSATVLEARAGANAAGDALITDRRQLALAVVTADCVPVLLAGPRRIAAIHAGWRGLAQSILRVTVDRFESPAKVSAWIGPAIGPCCYEVGSEVAEKVSRVSSQKVVVDGGHGRPHLDLVAAARLQLERLGVREAHSVDACTRCDAGRLWSYRREGPGAGRNVSVIWRF